MSAMSDLDVLLQERGLERSARESATALDLPRGFAVVYGELDSAGSSGFAFGRRRYQERAKERAAVRSALEQGMGMRRAAFRPARGTSLGVCGSFAERQERAYAEATGRNPRTIADYLRSIGIADAARIERAGEEWTGRAAPMLERVES